MDTDEAATMLMACTSPIAAVSLLCVTVPFDADAATMRERPETTRRASCSWVMLRDVLELLSVLYGGTPSMVTLPRTTSQESSTSAEPCPRAITKWTCVAGAVVRHPLSVAAVPVGTTIRTTESPMLVPAARSRAAVQLKGATTPPADLVLSGGHRAGGEAGGLFMTHAAARRVPSRSSSVVPAICEWQSETKKELADESTTPRSMTTRQSRCQADAIVIAPRDKPTKCVFRDRMLKIASLHNSQPVKGNGREPVREK